jgi:hypothetical protein
VRLSLAWLALLLVLLSAAAPLADVIEDCRVACTTDSEDECRVAGCCSCCPAVRFIAAAAPVAARAPDRTTESVVMVAALPDDAEPRGILHVPRPLAL